MLTTHHRRLLCAIVIATVVGLIYYTSAQNDLLSQYTPAEKLQHLAEVLRPPQFLFGGGSGSEEATEVAGSEEINPGMRKKAGKVLASRKHTWASAEKKGEERKSTGSDSRSGVVSEGGEPF